MEITFVKVVRWKVLWRNVIVFQNALQGSSKALTWLGMTVLVLFIFTLLCDYECNHGCNKTKDLHCEVIFNPIKK